MNTDNLHPVSHPPCDGCRRCCIRDMVRILPHEDASQWKTQPHPAPQFKGHFMLAHKKNGECIYLTENGCGNYDNRPQQCKEMDCRLIYQSVTYTTIRKAGNRMVAMWRKGKELINTHPI